MTAPRRRVAAVAVLASVTLLACGSSEGTLRACAVRPALLARGDAPTGPRRHETVTRDSLWPRHLAEDMASFRDDSVVRVLLVHQGAVVAADREYVTTRGGTIVAEPAEYNGLLATFTVELLRAFAAQAPTTRIIDAHLATESGLPLCD